MDFHVEIEKHSAVPIYAQLQEQIRLLIRRGALRPGDAMPSVRTLAVDLEINANTVARVYRDLQHEGLLRLERGVGTFIVDRLEEEAVQRGLNYLFNVVRPTHPDREGITRWLEGRRFKSSDDGLLRRTAAPPTR